MFELKLFGWGECYKCGKTIRHRYGSRIKGLQHLSNGKLCDSKRDFPLVRNPRPTK